MSVKLDAIMERLGREGLLAGGAAAFPDLIVAAVTADSRAVREGTLFCAIRGTTGDGHAFLGAAAAAGAAAALVERPDPTLSLPQIEVTSGRRAAAFAAAEFHGDPWRTTTLIGVTGTNGKTTTVSILRHLLASAGPAASIGTLGMIGPDGRVVPGTEGLTTPGPVQFAREMRKLAEDGVKAVAMEVSSHALDQERVCAATFAAGVFTNLSRDHLDYHPTIEEYRAAKMKLADLIAPGGVLVVNADDPAWDGVRREGVNLVRFGLKGRGEVQAEDIRFTGDGVEWHMHTPSCTATVRLPLLGEYNVSNALGAAAALWGLGWTSNRIAEAMSTLPQVPGRLERVPTDSGPTVVIDFAHTPDALERALKALRPLVRGRLIAVFGAGGDRDPGKRAEMGRIAGELADLAIVTSDNPRHEDPARIIAQIEQGMGSARRTSIVDRRDAIEHAIESGGPEDVVLLAGKGHETYQIWGDEKRPFDERAIVAEILQGKARTG